ncbi:MAG: PilZ domain-containing protein [Acidobacteria bacterium]|nr:PilZ domain-containing protein [Acidobacteriota bacterium]
MEESRVLLFNSPWSTAERDQIGLLGRAPFVVERLRRSADLLRRLETERFAMVILWMPSDGIDIEDVLPVIRSANSPCSRCILILLTPQSRLEDCHPYLRLGVNALLPSSVSLAELDAEIGRQTQAARRVETRLLVRLRVTIPTAPQSVICQTVNVSATGMFLASTVQPPLGTGLAFEMPLPGWSQPIAGEAFVVRLSSIGRDRQRGLGVTFTSFRRDGGQLLREFIEGQLPPDGLLQS